MDGSKVDLTAPFRSREIFKLQTFPDVMISRACGSTISYRIFFFFSEFYVYFIKTKAYICLSELVPHRRYFVGLLFREISLKREEQSNRADIGALTSAMPLWINNPSNCVILIGPLN